MPQRPNLEDPTTRRDETVAVARADLSALRRREPLTLVFCHRDGTTVAGVPEGGELIVGRSVPADVIVPDDTLSRRHARVTLDGNDVFIEDLGSKNGTFKNGAPLDGMTRVSPADHILVGGVALVLTRRPPTSIDAAGFMAHDAFNLLLSFETARARHFQRPFVLAVVKTLDGAHVARLASDVTRALRPVDRVAAFSDDTLEFLIPEAGAKDAHAVVTAALDIATALGVKAAAVIAPFPNAGTTADALVARAHRAVQRLIVDRALETLGDDVTDVPAPLSKAGVIVQSTKMRELYETVTRIAPSHVPILIHGETGTGKELVARAVHERSTRARAPMVAVNCAAIPLTLIESTLFGHVRGAFTGADRDHAGYFEQAQGGTVFLDEVGELPLEAQAKLLRVLENKKLVRVGGTKEVDLDVRVVAATHRDLEEMCAEGRFREDLLFRLNVVGLEIPALRERRDEVRPLVAHFITETCRGMGKTPLPIDGDALDALSSYTWPGNVRELRNAIERASVVARHGRITVDELPDRVRRFVPSSSSSSHSGARPGASNASLSSRSMGPADMTIPDPSTGDLRARLRDVERAMILEALRGTDGVQTRAATSLGLPLRTLVHKMKALGVRRSPVGYVVEDVDGE